MTNGRAGLIHITGQCIHTPQRRTQGVLGKFNAVPGRPGIIRCLASKAGHFPGRRRHFIHGGHHTVDILVLAGGLFIGIPCNGANIRGLPPHLGIHIFEVIDHFSQAGQEGIEATSKVNQLGMGVNIQFTGKIALGTGQVAHALPDFIQGPGNRTNQQHQYRNRKHDHDNAHYRLAGGSAGYFV